MAKNIITLYIDDVGLRLVETHGQRIKKWAYLPLDPGTMTNNIVTNESALATKIRQLFKALKIQGKRTAVGLSGLHCLSRPITLPQLPKDMLDEAVRREAKRTLPVPPEQLYLSWQTIPSTEKQSTVFLVAIPRSTVDTLVSALRQAGLEPSFVGVKPLLLSGTIKETTAIIIDTQSTEFDVTIMTRGIPQTIRTVRFPNEISTENSIEMISGELDRMINFYNTNNPNDLLAADVPIFTSGKLTDDPVLHRALSQNGAHPVQPLRPTIDYPDGFDNDTYLVNIGLTLQQLNGRIPSGASLLTLNALPAHYQARQVSFSNVAAVPGAVVAIGLLAFYVFTNQSAAAHISSTTAKVDTNRQLLQQTLAYKKDLSANIEKLRGQVAQIETSYKNFDAAATTINKQSARINTDLTETMNRLPNTVELTSISYDGSTLVISGVTQRRTDILKYLENLKDSKAFGEIIISKISKVQDEVMEFTLLVNLERIDTQTSAIQVVLGALPANVSLTGVRQSDNTIAVSGHSADETSLVSFLEALEGNGAFTEVIVNGKTNTEDGGLDFSLTVRTQK